MKHILITTIAAALLVGCAKPPPPDISIKSAASKGNIEAVKQHLAAGTDVNAKEDGKYGTPLHRAADAGHKKVVELLLANGANVNARISMGTPLHEAVTGGHKDIAELLIANGADVNAKTNAGMTPLSLANVFDRTEIADLLRKHDGKTKSELIFER